jgi:kinetochore protein Spc7/SPC105
MSPSPSRRKSIAVTHQVNKARPAHKRRPHSITPGDSVLKQLSPASRARQSLVCPLCLSLQAFSFSTSQGPRKSILKSRSSLAPEDADDITQTMDLTRVSINDNATRKSLGRRVSFASHAQVRVFEKDPNRSDTSPSATNDSGQSTQSGAQSGPVVNDENDYPGASSMARRRSSMRRSAVFSENGEASMDMDSEPGSSPLPAGFSIQGSFLQDEEPDDVSGVWDEEADMDLTTNLAASKPRRSSLGLSSLLQPGQDMSLDDPSRSDDIPHDAAGDLSREESEPTEFTVPLNKSLRMPEPPSAEWLALRAMTHAGDGPFEPPPSDMDEDGPLAQEGGVGLGEEDMDLTEAETRIRRMRESLGIGNIPQEDSFTSSEGSSIGDGDNQTINLTNVWRESLGTDSSSVMDLSNFQGNSGENSADEAISRVFPPMLSLEDPPAPPDQHNSQLVPFDPALTTPPDVIDSHDPPQPPVPPVFSKPGHVFSAPKRASLSPSKLKSPASSRKVGTAAFALPVPRPQPKKPEATRVEDDDPFRYEGGNSSHNRQASQRPPSKLTNAPASTEPVATTSTAPRSSATGLRRPSGYFAQRKSLGPSGVLNIPQLTSPQKKASQRRTSEAGISEIGQNAVNLGRENFEPSISVPYPWPPVEGPSKGANLSDPSESPLPIPPLFAETNSVPPTESEAPAPQRTVTFAEVEAAEQWRNNVQPPDFTEEDEGVRTLFVLFYQVILAYLALAFHIC